MIWECDFWFYIGLVLIVWLLKFCRFLMDVILKLIVGFEDEVIVDLFF